MTSFYIIFQNQEFVKKMELTCDTSNREWEPDLNQTDYSCKHSKLAKTSGLKMTLCQTVY